MRVDPYFNEYYSPLLEPKIELKDIIGIWWDKDNRNIIIVLSIVKVQGAEEKKLSVYKKSGDIFVELAYVQAPKLLADPGRGYIAIEKVNYRIVIEEGEKARFEEM